MQSFDYKKAKSSDEALRDFASRAEHARYLAGGTTLIDLMKLDVETPRTVIDVNALPLAKIEKQKDGSILVGALVKNSDLAHDELIRKEYAVLSQALLAGASAQLRNKATTAGNLLQRTRCVYFRDSSKPCNKREPKSGCSAIEGFNRNLAILGVSRHCIATNPSDMNVAMRALEARVHVQGPKSRHEISIDEFHTLPGDTPQIETTLLPGELITGVSLPQLPAGTKSLYLKLRDRASYEFALASAAVVMTHQGGTISRVRIAMGGIGTKPWRSINAEKILEGGAGTEEKFKAAADEFVRGAEPQSGNGFKVELAKRCLVHALKTAMKV